jgi:hypothetical protein
LLLQVHHPHCKYSRDLENSLLINRNLSADEGHPELLSPENREHLQGLLTEEAVKAVDVIEYITEHLKKDNEYKRVGGVAYIHA